MALNKQINKIKSEAMRNRKPDKTASPVGPTTQWSRESNQRKKVEQEIGEDNPMLRLRHALKPTEEEIAARSPRDKKKKFLLQKELASRIPCCLTTVWQAEKHKRFPLQKIVHDASLKLYSQCFPSTPPPKNTAPKTFMSTPAAKADFEKRGVKKKR